MDVAAHMHGAHKGEAFVCGWLRSAIRGRERWSKWMAQAQLTLWHKSGWGLLVWKADVVLRVYRFCAVWSRTMTACVRAWPVLVMVAMSPHGHKRVSRAC